MSGMARARKHRLRRSFNRRRCEAPAPLPAPDEWVPILAAVGECGRQAIAALEAMATQMAEMAPAIRAAHEAFVAGLLRPRSVGVTSDELRAAGPGFEVLMPGMDLDDA